MFGKKKKDNDWIGGVKYLGVDGWTQTEYGTLLPPPRASMVAATNSDYEYYSGTTIPANSRYDLDEIAAAVKKSLGYLERPLVKCRHCGQWGAAYCACKHCGAPIDPE